MHLFKYSKYCSIEVHFDLTTQMEHFFYTPPAPIVSDPRILCTSLLPDFTLVRPSASWCCESTYLSLIKPFSMLSRRKCNFASICLILELLVLFSATAIAGWLSSNIVVDS